MLTANCSIGAYSTSLDTQLHGVKKVEEVTKEMVSASALYMKAMWRVFTTLK